MAGVANAVIKLFFHLWFLWQSLLTCTNRRFRVLCESPGWPSSLLSEPDALLIAVLVNPKMYSHQRGLLGDLLYSVVFGLVYGPAVAR